MGNDLGYSLTAVHFGPRRRPVAAAPASRRPLIDPGETMDTAASAKDRLDALLARDEDALARTERLMEHMTGEREPLATVLRQHLRTGGKRIRARLAIAAGRALGADPARLIPWAAACEMLHNATLIHDDLQDGDTVRRGHPTIWVEYGAAQAINAGDLMLMLPFLATDQVDAPARTRAALSALVARSACTTVHGQAMELVLPDAAPEDLHGAYIRAIEGKTSALFGLPVEGAALVAGRDMDAVAIATPFTRLGTLFQFQDDVLDLYGEKGRAERGADLKEGKVSSLVVHHLLHHPGDREWLFDLLSAPREETAEDAVHDAIERFRTGGALGSVLKEMRAIADAVTGDATLAGMPDLQAMATLFVELVVQPIAHLWNEPAAPALSHPAAN